MTEGWLVLTEDTLCLYDRDPRGVTRKPIHRLHLKEPGVAYVIIPSVTRQSFPQAHAASLVKAFGVQIHSSKHSKQLCFVAATLQSKIEWVELIQRALSEQLHHGQDSKEGLMDHSTSPSKLTPKGGRELKAVSIVPLSNTTPLKGSSREGGRRSGVSSHEGSGLDFSIRSSMLDGSFSDDSYV